MTLPDKRGTAWPDDLYTHDVHELGKQVPQLPEEPYIAWLAYLHWIKRGTPSNKDLAAVTRFSIDSLCKWRPRYKWQQRLDTSPAASQAQLAAMRIQASVDMFNDNNKSSQRIMRLIDRSLTKLYIADTLVDAPAAGLTDLARTLTAVHNYERLEADQSTANVAIAVPQLTPEQIADMSVEELQALKAAMPKAFERDTEDE